MTAEAAPERFTCFAIAIAYASLGGMWIFISDNLFTILLNQTEANHHSVAISHWMFIAFSAILLFWLLRVWQLAISYSQQSLKNANRALKSVSECTKAITRITDERELMQEICKIFVEVGGYRFAWVGFAGHDAEKSIRPVAYWGFEENFIDSMNATWRDCERGRGPAGTTIRTGKTTTFQNFRTHPDYRPWREQALKCGYASGISLPLKEEERAFGALVIFSGQPQVFDDEEIARMEELAEDLSFGIKTLHMEAERKRALEERIQLATVIEQSTEGVLTINEDGRIHYLNPAFAKICSVETIKAVGKSIYDFDFCRLNKLFSFEIQKVIFSGIVCDGHFVNRRNDGSSYEINAKISPVYTQNGVSRYVVMIRDVTNELLLEQQLRQAQKMEAIATLSGGIAHDFNNILAVIISNAEMFLEDYPAAAPDRQCLDIILKAGVRGKTLVKQIMNLSQPAVSKRESVEIAPVVKECLALLRASLPTTIELRQQFFSDNSWIAADPTQIHQVIMNLCTNAADAMHGGGGFLEISLSDAQLKAEDTYQFPNLPPGAYLELKVTDSGHGMARETLARIFDPFFTSKKPGKGTGLGLSVAHGIIKSHGGAVSVTSEPGKGTVFTVLFPQVNKGEQRQQEPLNQELLRGEERILFVDDEEDYVRSQKRLLERLGYQVTAGTDSRKVLELFQSHPEDFDLLITDQTMPHLTGEALARKVLRIRPDLPVILCSGSAPDSIDLNPERARAAGIRAILQKPVDKHELYKKVRHLLNDSRRLRGEHAEYSYS